MPDAPFLNLRVVKSAVLVPRRDHTDKTQGAGVVRHGKRGPVAVQGAGVRRRGREYVVAPRTDDIEPVARVDAAVYGGFLFHHYGHFMLESLGRLWAPPVDVPIVWLPSTSTALTPWQHDMLDLVDANAERVVATDGPIEVGELLIADQGFEVRRSLHPWFAEYLGRVDATPDGNRLWLGRSGLGELAGVAEEAAVEAQVAARGWTVVHLESMSVRQQVDTLARASHVAGVEGSAFHNLLFVRDYRGTIDVFTRQGDSNFEVIAATTGWDQVRHDLPGGTSETWTRPSGFRDTRWSGVDAAAVADRLEAAVRRAR